MPREEKVSYPAKGKTERGYDYWLSGIVVFSFAFAILALGMNRDINLYDEGFIATGAYRVAAGAIPHRDFFTLYGPGQFCVLALAFKFFGPSFLVERIWDLAIKAGIAWLVGSIALRMIRRTFVAIVVVVCILWLTYLGFFGYPAWPALLLSLLSIEILLPVFEGRHSAGSILAAGCCVGMIVLFRYDVGFFACVAESAILLAFGVCSKAREQTRISQVANLLVPFWLGIAIICVPLMAAYAVTEPISDFMFQVIEFPSKYYARMRSLPFPRLSLGMGVNYIVYLPPLVIFVAIATSLTYDGHTRQAGPLSCPYRRSMLERIRSDRHNSHGSFDCSSDYHNRCCHRTCSYGPLTLGAQNTYGSSDRYLVICSDPEPRRE
jgi:hypothetical protein